ncbi:hypothetical protein BC940DRAFT_301234 [Gongronella butleri]|nr:hypothetical protein BC940DRAFT_301234 [Gongronella butleri]
MTPSFSSHSEVTRVFLHFIVSGSCWMGFTAISRACLTIAPRLKHLVWCLHYFRSHCTRTIRGILIPIRVQHKVKTEKNRDCCLFLCTAAPPSGHFLIPPALFIVSR